MTVIFISSFRRFLFKRQIQCVCIDYYEAFFFFFCLGHAHCFFPRILFLLANLALLVISVPFFLVITLQCYLKMAVVYLISSTSNLVFQFCK